MLFPFSSAGTETSPQLEGWKLASVPERQSNMGPAGPTAAGEKVGLGPALDREGSARHSGQPHPYPSSRVREQARVQQER